MHCLSSASLWSLLPNWIQSLWISQGEQSRERLDQTVPNVSSPDTGTEPAVYALLYTEVAYNVTKPLPACIPNQTERAAWSRTPLPNRPQSIYMKPDDKMDCEIIELPDVVFVEGKVYLRERGT
ncbi:hypothetical protein N7517_008072 [Penicillium concentricum]|uniref:Uncharacterized protein n=1 Tax=Penicillium concentricum TaxID=293559 RepID=A0A9W9V3T1_9EURO|nr:uncharacterized protein N7517_008072 [Penicillium concentricum]KAJ5365186.1 hypothetical protein N7517_008072 [Penicillium concentricum]